MMGENMIPPVIPTINPCRNIRCQTYLSSALLPLPFKPTRMRTLVAKLDAKSDIVPITNDAHEAVRIQCGQRRMNMSTNGMMANIIPMAMFPMRLMACSEAVLKGGWVR